MRPTIQPRPGPSCPCDRCPFAPCPAHAGQASSGRDPAPDFVWAAASGRDPEPGFALVASADPGPRSARGCTPCARLSREFRLSRLLRLRGLQPVTTFRAAAPVAAAGAPDAPPGPILSCAALMPALAINASVETEINKCFLMEAPPVVYFEASWTTPVLRKCSRSSVHERWPAPDVPVPCIR